MDFIGIGEQDRCDAGPPLRRELKKALSGKTLEGFTNRRRTYRPSRSESGCLQLLSRAQLAGQDGGSQFLVDPGGSGLGLWPVSCTHLRAHETVLDLVCRLLL